MKKDYLDKLKKYSALSAVSAMTPFVVNADIIYSDVNPDELVTVGNSFSVDINNDATLDFIFTAESGSIYKQIKIATLSTQNGVAANVVMSASSSSYNLVSNILNSASINDLNTFLYGGFLAGYYMGSSGANTFGNFVNLTNAYVAVKLNVSGNDHYGWIRINTINTDRVIIKDYAYEATPNTSIKAGHVDPIGNVDNISFTGNVVNGNASEITFSFDRIADEEYVQEYRVIAVEPSEASTFNLAAANAVQVGNYLSLSPNGSNFSQAFPITFKDRNGRALEANTPYKLFILAISSYPDQDILVNSGNTLSESSQELNLNVGFNETLKRDIKITNSKNEIFISTDKSITEIDLFDLNGRKMDTKFDNTNTQRIDISNFPSGVYVININTEEGFISKKIIK